MAYTTDLNTIDNPTSGAAAPATWGDAVRDNFNELGIAWTAYTPTWVASGTAVALGNGTLVGAYRKIGKTLDFRIYWKAGSTTTFGTGTYTFALPSGVTSVAQSQVGPLFGNDAGTQSVTGAFLVDASATVVRPLSTTSGQWAQTVPHTWAVNDEIVITGTIEVA